MYLYTKKYKTNLIFCGVFVVAADWLCVFFQGWDWRKDAGLFGNAYANPAIDSSTVLIQEIWGWASFIVIIVGLVIISARRGWRLW